MKLAVDLIGDGEDKSVVDKPVSGRETSHRPYSQIGLGEVDDAGTVRATHAVLNGLHERLAIAAFPLMLDVLVPDDVGHF